MIHRIIYQLGVLKRNPSLKKYYSFLQKSDHWNKEQLLRYQIETAREFLQFAYEHSAFYKEEFNKVHFCPSQFQSLQDLERLPVIDKSVLLKENQRIQSDFRFKKLFFSETSGTSGQVLTFYKNEEWDSANRASIFRGYSWYGVRPWEKNGYFWGYNISSRQKFKTFLLDKLQNRFRIFSYQESEIRKFCNRLKQASYLGGYSSMIYEVAKQVNLMGLSGQYHLKMVKGTSEKIYDAYQSEVQKAFGCKIISEYGATETGIIAFECPCGNMHINSEGVIVEEMDGEIIVTNLYSRSFPIIRYRLGDYIQLAPADMKCPCGRAHPVLLNIDGRVGKKVVGKTQNFPSLTFYYVFKNLKLQYDIELNYQAIQDVPGKVVLNIEQNQENNMSYLKEELTRYFMDDVDFDIHFGRQLHSMNGKLRDFISMLD